MLNQNKLALIIVVISLLSACDSKPEKKTINNPLADQVQALEKARDAEKKVLDAQQKTMDAIDKATK